MSLGDENIINRNCEWEDCSNKGGCYIFGRSYCGHHNVLAIEKHFYEELELWGGSEEPRGKLKNLFARYIEILADKKPFRHSYLTSGRIKDRTYDYKYKDGIIEFKIVRHLNAWKNESSMREVVEHWKFDSIKKKKYFYMPWMIHRKMK